MAATRTRMTKSRISSYMRNVGKSFGYALGDSLKDMNPTVTAMFRSTAEQSKELYQSVKNFDAKSLGFQDSDLKGTISQGLKDLRNNALEDIRTGKWYNKDRMRSFENQMAEDMLGINFDDFGDFDDFNFDDSDLDEQASITEDATKATAKAMDAVGGKVSTAVSTAAIKSADYIVESGRANTKAIYSLNQAGFSQVNKGMAAINGNLQLLVNIAEPLTTHIQNSALFYTKTTEYQNKSLELLQQIANNTAPKSSNAYGTSSNKRKTYGDYITADGVIDFKSLITDGGKRIKDNAEMFTSMLGMIPGGEKGLIKMATASPLHFAMTTVISGLFNMKNKQGRSIKSAFEDFNKVLSNFSLGLLGRMKNARFGNNILSPYLRGIRDFLIPSDGKIQRKANSGNYEKGKVDWDGISRRALTEVIPKQLGQILSILERNFGPAGNYRVYDYTKGEFKDTRRIAAESKIEQRKIARGAGGDLFNDVRRSLKYSGMNTKDRRNYEKQLDSLLEYMMLTGNYNILSSGFDFGKAGMSGSMAADLQERIKAIGKTRGGQYKISALAGNVLSAGNKLDARNKNADNLENALVDKSIKSGKLLDSDEFGLNQSEYLRRILYNVSYIAKNLKNLVGVPGVGGYNKEGTQITWEDGDWITKSNNRAGKADTSSDKLPELSRSYDPKGSVEKTFGETPNGPSFSANEKEVLKKYGIDPANATDLDTLRSVIPDSEPLKDQILRNATNYVGRNKVNSWASGIYNKFRNGKNGDKFQRFEESINASTDEVTAGLDRMAEGLNKFVYDKDFGLLSLMNTLSLGIATLIPKPIRDMAKAGWDKIKGSAFGQATGETLKSIGGSMLDWWSGNGSGLVNREYTRMQNGMYAGGNFWGNYERGSFSTQASPLLGYAGGRSKRGKSRRRQNKRKAQKAQSAEEAASEPPLEYDVEGESLLNKIAHTVSANLIDKISGVIGSGKEDPAKEKEKVQGTIKKLMEDAGLGKGAIGAGAVIGAGTSLLTGAFLGPIAGAAIGAAVGFASKSETAQKFLFGDFEDEIGPDGKPTGKKTDVRSGGLFSKELSNFMKDHGVSTAKGAGTGMLVGTFMGSPVLGAVLGASVGYIKSSETAKKAIFGEVDKDGNVIQDGIIPVEFQRTLKQKFPFFAGGIGAAILMAPGPLIPKIAIGATIGAIVGEDKGAGLKKWFFGDGKEDKGFLGYMNENLFKPILGTIDKTFNILTKGLRDKLTQLVRGFGNFLKDRLAKSGVGRAAIRVGKGVGKVIGGGLKGVVNVAGSPFRAANRALEKMSLSSGYAFRGEDNQYLTSSQRLQLAAEKGYKYRETGSTLVDQYLKNLNPEEYDQFIADMEAAERGEGGEERIAQILEGSRHSKLKYRDITHALQQARIDKDKWNSDQEAEKARKASPEYNVTERIPSLIERVARGIEGIGEYLGANIGEVKDTSYDPSTATDRATGGVELDQTREDNILDENGNLSHASTAGKAAIRKGELEAEANASMAEMDDRQQETTAAIINLGDRIMGKDDDKKDKKESLFDKIKNAIVGEKGLLGGLLGFITGKGTLPLVSKFPALTSLLSTLEIGISAAGLGFLSGKLDDWFAQHGGNGSGDTKNVESYEDGHSYVSGTVENEDGTKEKIELATDEKGKVKTETTEDGRNVVTALDGRQFDVSEVKDIKYERTENQSKRGVRRYLSSLAVNRSTRSLTEGMIHGAGNLIASTSVMKNAGKTTGLGYKVGSKLMSLSDNLGTTRKLVTNAVLNPKATAEAAEKGVKEFAESANKHGFVNTLVEQIKKLFQKIVSLFGSRVDNATIAAVGEAVEEGAEEIAEKTAKEAGGEAIEGAAKCVPVLGWILAIADAAWEFEEGWNRAARDFKVNEATTMEKFINGLIEAIISLIGMIPAVGTALTIAGSVFKNSIMDIIINALISKGYMKDLATRRQESKKEYEAYQEAMRAQNANWKNETYDTWNAREHDNYTWGEKIVNGIKSSVYGGNKATKSGYRNGVYVGTTVETTTTGGGASGVITQFDPRYNRYHVGGKSFAANGCGPASAVMAMGGNLGDAVRVAQRYQTVGGTDAAYFGEMFNRNGMNAHFYTRGGGSSLIGDIASGKPTVLMGQDIFNTSKDYSPFGPNNHYVVANGFDRAGNLLISDPEQRGVRRYNPAILNNVKIGVSGGNSAYAAAMQGGNLNTSDTTSAPAAAAKQAPTTTKSAMNYNSGPFAVSKEVKQKNDLGTAAAREDKIKAIKTTETKTTDAAVGTGGVGDGSTAAYVFAFLATRGRFSDGAACGIMANLQAESGMDPTALQKASVHHAAGIAQWENYAQQTGRWLQLKEYADSKGTDWTDLNTQLEFLIDEVEGSQSSYFNKVCGGVEKFKTTANPREATLIFQKAFERGNPEKAHMDKRYAYAEDFFRRFSGMSSIEMEKILAQGGASGDIGNNSDNINTSGADKKASIGGILNTIVSAFTQGFGKIFSGGTDETEDSPIAGVNTEEDSVSGTRSISGTDPVSYMESIKNKITYTFGSHDIENGKGDCSGTVNWAVKKASGIDIGGNTAAMYNDNNLKTVWYENGNYADSAPGVAKRNDVLLFSRPSSSYTVGRPDRVGHVGLYMGGNKYIHIGQGTGPYESTLDRKSKLIKVARIVDDNGNEVSFDGASEVTGMTATQDKEQLQADRFQMTAKAGSVREAAMGSGLLHYGSSKAGNYILRDNTRQYYSGGASGVSHGGSSGSIGGNLISTVKNAVSNTVRSAAKKSSIELPDNVSAIRGDTAAMREKIEFIAATLEAMASSKNVPKDTTVSNNEFKIPESVFSNLQDTTNSITSV